jgi:hypothetical protein
MNMPNLASRHQAMRSSRVGPLSGRLAEVVAGAAAGSSAGAAHKPPAVTPATAAKNHALATGDSLIILGIAGVIGVNP